jgi:hypothetical protein
MHGAAMARNIRRTGVQATKRGRTNAEYVKSVFDGPTAERIAKAQSHYTVGDDKQGTRIYHFHDTTIDRLYSRLARGREATGSVRAEYVALQKYRLHWHRAGLECSLGSVDLNRVFASDPGSMSGMAKTEGQAHHRKQYREARDMLENRDMIGWKAHIVVENVMCAEISLEQAGWSIGSFNSRTARDGADARCSARVRSESLAKLWGISLMPENIVLRTPSRMAQISARS